MLFDNFSICLVLTPIIFNLFPIQFATCDDNDLQTNLSNLQRFIPTMSTDSYAQESQITDKYDKLKSANDYEISSGSVTVDSESLRRLELLIKTLIRTYMKLFMIDSQRTVETTLLSATRFNDFNTHNKPNAEMLSQYRLDVPNVNSVDFNMADVGRRPPIRPQIPSALNVNRRQEYTVPPATTSGTIMSTQNPQQMVGRLESILPFGFGSNDSTTGTRISRPNPQMIGQLETILPYGFNTNDLNTGTVSRQGPQLKTGQLETILPYGFDGESSRSKNKKPGQVSLSMQPQTQQQLSQTQSFQIPVLVDHSDALVQSQPPIKMQQAKMSSIPIPSATSDFQFPTAKSSQSTTTTTTSGSRQIPATLYVTTRDGVPTVEGVKIDKKIS